MKKFLIVYILFLMVFISKGFVPASEQLSTKDALSEKLLEKFDEKSLVSGTGSKSQVRVTILMSNHPSIMLIWHPEADPEEIAVEGKTLPLNGKIFDKKNDSKLLKGQRRIFGEIFSLADPSSLPKDDWRTANALGGSIWIVEIASAKDCFRLVRRNPMTSPSEFAIQDKVSQDRIWQEQFLVTFVLNLLMASGIDVNKVY